MGFEQRGNHDRVELAAARRVGAVVHGRPEDDDFRQAADEAEQLRGERIGALDQGRVRNRRMGRAGRAPAPKPGKRPKVPVVETWKIGCISAAVISERRPSLQDHDSSFDRFHGPRRDTVEGAVRHLQQAADQ
ncbi:MAG: hypothetical protein QM777_06570 [Pseudorhodoferax sp.]